MSYTQLKVLSLGGVAQEQLSQDQAGYIIGTTSRGLFLRFSTGRVVFLSLEPFRGPLSVNCRPVGGQFRDLPVGRPVEARAGILHGLAAGLVIDIRSLSAWKAPQRQAAILPLAARRERVRQVAGQIWARQEQGTRNVFLSLLQESKDFSAARLALHSGQAAEAATTLEAWIGCGPGLTPSGDDLLVGLLLALSRWGDVLCPDLPASQLSQAILSQACARTTTLSANLIECAARGQADERLVQALDGLVSGEPEVAVCVAALADWGSSSGCDAFLGMSLAMP